MQSEYGCDLAAVAAVGYMVAFFGKPLDAKQGAIDRLSTLTLYAPFLNIDFISFYCHGKTDGSGGCHVGYSTPCHGEKKVVGNR
jgi:hypothetical protein